MTPLHVLAVLLVVAIWGINFVFIRIGLDTVPPFLLCALRFTFSAFPAVLLLPRPRCGWKDLVAFGFVLFCLQFGFLFAGMSLGMPPGLASLLMQVQVFFTMALAGWVFDDRPTAWRLAGAAISAAGIAWVGLHTQGEVTWTGLVLTLAAALSWGGGNILSKKIRASRPLALVAWGSLVAAPFHIVLSLVLYGPRGVADAVLGISPAAVGSIAFIVCGSTFVGYSLWGYLLNTYPASVIAPFTLLVPVFGFAGSALFLGEAIPPWKLGAAALVIGGLCFNLLEGRWARWRARRS